MSALPIVAQGSRVPQANLVAFESMLSAADEATEFFMNTKSHAGEYATSDESATGVLNAVIDTIAALSNTQPPPRPCSRHTMVSWVSHTVLNIRDQAVARAVEANATTPPMNPEAIASCMELISKLNSSIGGLRSHQSV